MAKKKAPANGTPRKPRPKAGVPPKLGVVYGSPEDFAEACRAAQVQGTLPAFPAPPAPMPANWWRDAFAAFLRTITPLGPITVNR